MFHAPLKLCLHLDKGIDPAKCAFRAGIWVLASPGYCHTSRKLARSCPGVRFLKSSCGIPQNGHPWFGWVAVFPWLRNPPIYLCNPVWMYVWKTFKDLGGPWGYGELTCLPRQASFEGLPSTRCSLAGFFPRQGPGVMMSSFGSEESCPSSTIYHLPTGINGDFQ